MERMTFIDQYTIEERQLKLYRIPPKKEDDRG